ncbi:LysR family transcriptional regulator [Streptomyces sp. NPDC051561]|uniref:LysR family transcriptional regulator n=1 Tax=Streptomyces sp. NPDC051561 TaxID=3365658 RepID=UPI00379A3C7F
MELRQLQYFVTVVEEANFTRAAARLHLAQPGVSAQIRQLERELGQRLLDRTGRTVTTTEAGEAVLPYARAALAAAEAVRHTADEFTGLLRGRVRFGLVSGAPQDEFDVVSVLADFHRDHPDVEISLTEDASDRMLDALRGGELDVALIGLAQDEPPGVRVQVVVDEPLVAVVPAGHPLAVGGPEPGPPTVPLAGLGAYPLISLPRGTGVRGVLERVCAEAGFRPRVAFEAAPPPVLVQLAARGLGVAVLPGFPDSVLHRYGLRAVRITEPAVRARIGLVWPAAGPAGPAAEAFLTLLRACV